jgi:hypothetical protein
MPDQEPLFRAVAQQALVDLLHIRQIVEDMRHLQPELCDSSVPYTIVWVAALLAYRDWRQQANEHE